MTGSKADEAGEIEKESFQIIESRMASSSSPERDVVTRVIHSTADSDFADLLVFKNDPVKKGCWRRPGQNTQREGLRDCRGKTLLERRTKKNAMRL